MISSDWQLEQTGVDRVARRLTICAGSGFGLNGFSQKREYFKYPPETIGHFAPEVTKFGVWRPITNSQKTAIGGHFWPCRRQNLNAPDWLAGDAVLIAPVSKQIPWYQGILQGILRF